MLSVCYKHLRELENQYKQSLVGQENYFYCFHTFIPILRIIILYSRHISTFIQVALTVSGFES